MYGPNWCKDSCSPPAAIFGEVLLRSPVSERKARSKKALNAMNRKKAAFIYQFLVNDLATPYR